MMLKRIPKLLKKIPKLLRKILKLLNSWKRKGNFFRHCKINKFVELYSVTV